MANKRTLIVDVHPGRLIIREGSRSVHEASLGRPAIEPFLKWAGGKQWLAWAAPYLTPKKWSGHYLEPFLGGGAFFFALEPGRATLSDKNADLISTYRALRDNPDHVIRLLRRYPHNSDFYYRIRARVPQSRHSRAARFIYLNRTCWNGLYRTNRSGKFNTPFGSFKNPTICNAERIRRSARLLRRPTLCAGDFERVTDSARSGDLVYLDPPYITGHQNNGFLKYNAQLFSWSDQQRLAEVVSRLVNTGVHVLASNADHPAVLALYKGLHYYRATRRSLIAGALEARGVIGEALLSSYPLVDLPSEVL